jgi:hypothetical protein
MVKIDKGFSWPDLGSKFLAGDEFTRVIQQRGQYLDRLALQAQLDASLSQLAGPNIELKNIKPHDARGWDRCPHTNSPKDC